MGVAKESIILEWDTGTTSNRKTHTVKLEIPPHTISIKRSKTVQYTATTKGHVFNHGLEKLATITANGTAYQPPLRHTAIQDGFNPDASLSGLEYLNAAYVASGRLSSSESLTNTISNSKLLSILKQSSNTPVTPSDGLTKTVSDRTSKLTTVSEEVKKIGTLQSDNTITVDNSANSITFTDDQVTQLKNSLKASTYTLTNPTLRDNLLTKLDTLTTSNVVTVFKDLQQLSLTEPTISDFMSKFEFLYYTYGSETAGITIAGVDPTVLLYMKQDPFIILKALSSSSILGSIKSQKKTLGQILREDENKGADDWVITIYMYWQNHVYSGHFENFSLTQRAQINNLWDWDFTFVAHQAWIMKNNNILPYDRAFDTALTNEISPGNNVSQTRNRFNTLNRLLALSEGLRF